MADRQLLAKLGVVILLGLNVGAYYLFWPKNNGHPIERAERAPAIAPAAPIPARPENFPVQAVKHAETIRAPGLPVKNEKATEADDRVSRLLDLIQKENVQPIPVVGERIEVPPPLPAPIPLELKPVERPTKPSDPALVVPGPNPRTLPPLKAEPINDPTDPNVATAAALTQKSQQSAWLVNVKESSVPRRVTAKLRGAAPALLPAEFEILCDRVDAQGADGLQAFGNVTFIGAGIKGVCQRLTIPGNAPTLAFEGQVRITPENVRGWSLPSSQLHGERFVWEQPTNHVDINAAEFRPAGLLLPSPPLPRDVGVPK